MSFGKIRYNKIGYWLAAVATAAAFCTSAAAQGWPQQKTITIIQPFGAGGGSDVQARIIQPELEKALNARIVVDSRPGANGSIGTALVAKAPPDGYTLLLTANSTYSINPHLMKELPYDQLKDFVPVATIATGQYFLVVNAGSGWKTVADVVKAAKAEPGKLTYGFWTSNVMISNETFAKLAGIQIRKVPYKGSAEAVTDLVAGRVSLIFIDSNAVRSFIDSGALRFVAVTSPKRTSLEPAVPTMVEEGYPVLTGATTVLFAPTGTPRPIVERLNAEMVKIVTTSKPVRDRFATMALEPAALSLPEVNAFVPSQLARWGEMVRGAGLQKE